MRRRIRARGGTTSRATAAFRVVTLARSPRRRRAGRRHQDRFRDLLAAAVLVLGWAVPAVGGQDRERQPGPDAPPPQEQEQPPSEPESAEVQEDPEESREEDPHEDGPAIRIEEHVVVTGTAIQEAPIDSPFVVSAVDRQNLVQEGAPSLVDMFRNLNAAVGTLGETNSWFNGLSNAIPESVAAVDLRGLGPSRTLLLLNGRRQAPIATRLVGGRFVDGNAIPFIAIDRLDVMKEGAGAVYGSDAISGVVNVITRSRFEGLEVQMLGEHFSGAGDSRAGVIWGKRFGSHHAVFSVEHQRQAELRTAERDSLLKPYPDWRFGWSGSGNPGVFMVPGPGGDDRGGLFEAPRFLDPRCEEFGGYADTDSRTCRYRYQTHHNIIERIEHTRSLFELGGDLGEDTHYGIEVLFAGAVTPRWSTSASYPPVVPYDGMQVVPAENPGRRQFVADYPTLPSTSGEPLDLTGGEPWYFFGRLVGNAGPARTVHRETGTRRVKVSLGGRFRDTGLHYDLGAAWSDTRSDFARPAEYKYRTYLAYRGFGGAGCGVGVEVDPTSPAGMRLGPVPDGVRPGSGDCFFANPFSNAIEFSDQPRAAFETTPNPDYRTGLANPAELLGWIASESRVASNARLFAADATLNGTMGDDRIGFAVGYKLRRLGVGATPNAASDLTIQPCPVPGDFTCAAGTGPFIYSSGHLPYDARQTTHGVFSELAIRLSEALDGQVAAHFERYELGSSFDPKLSLRARVNDHVALRGTIQTLFRTPSVDDVNEQVFSSQDWVGPSGTYKAIDNAGNPDLISESAFNYNLGVMLQSDPAWEWTFDYWRMALRHQIGELHHATIVDAYADPALRSAVQDRIVCPGGVTDGSCDPVDIERIRVSHINYPQLTAAGVDWRLEFRRTFGAAALIAAARASHTLSHDFAPLEYNGVVLRPAESAVGYLNRANRLAPPIPSWRGRGKVTLHWSDYSIIGVLRHISSYEDRTASDVYRNIASWTIVDANLQWRVPGSGMTVLLSALNLLGRPPPIVQRELSFDGRTHNGKGRRLRLGIIWRFDG